MEVDICNHGILSYGKYPKGVVLLIGNNRAANKPYFINI